MRQSISCVDHQSLAETLTTLQSYLHSELSISAPFPVTTPGANRECESVRIKVKVENTAPSTEGLGQVVFVGVGLTITSAGPDELFQRLVNSLQPCTFRRWQALEEREIVWEGDTLFGAEETDDSCVASRPAGGATLFPGETTTLDVELPADSLPFVSLKVTGTVSLGNLLHFGYVLKSFEEWSMPALAVSAGH